MKRDTRHIPVLLDEVLQALSPRPGQVFVDCTLGLGGHSAALLQRVGRTGKLIAIDFDPANIAIARAKLEAVGERHGATPGTVAVAWTLLNPAVDGAIAGVRRPGQVDPVLAAANLVLTEQEIDDIEGETR